MVTLTEEMIIARTKISNLESITKLNFCSRELSDVSILQKMRNVTVLSLSVNNIDSLEVFQFLTKLEDLFLRKNNVADLNQVCFLQALPELQNLWLQDNPCAANDEEYRLAVIRALPRLKKLDNILVESSEIERALRLGRPLAHPSLLEENYSESDEDEPYYPQQIREQPQDRSPSPEEEYQLAERTVYPQERVPPQVSSRVKEFSNPCETGSNGSYTNEVEDPRELYGEPPANHAYMNSRQPPPPQTFNKFEEEVPPSTRQPNHRPQMLPRSRTTDGELGHYTCPNFCSVAPGLRRPNERRTNVLNAVLCLIKELDFPNLEVVQMAIKCRMEELCDTSYTANNNSS